MTIKPKKILLVKNRALGDSIISLAAGKFVREQFPDAVIHYATPQWTTALFQTLDHPYDAIIPLNIRTITDVWNLFKELFTQKYDLIYEFHYGPRTGRIFKLYSMLSGSSYYSYNHHQTDVDSIINRDLTGLTLNLGLPLPNDLSLLIPQAKSFQSPTNILLGVVATRETKMWPLENYVELAKKLKDFFPASTIWVPLSNSKTDLSIKQKLTDLKGEEYLTFVHYPLEQLPALFNQCQLYIGNDTGLKHLAVFCGVKTYTFFGPEDPKEWHPYNSKDHFYFFQQEMPCRYQNAHYCGLQHCSTMKCLKAFSVQDVWEKLKLE